MRNFNLRAVRAPDGTINGFVRMTSVKGRSKVSGICAFFQVNTQTGKIYIDEQSLFFCGHQKDLAKNYNQSNWLQRSSPFSDTELAPYSDHQYSVHTGECDRAAKSGGFYRIPVAEMRLGSTQQMMIGHLMEQVKANMPEWVRGLVLDQVNLTDVNKRRAFGVLFSVFPNDFKEAAIAAGSYYHNHQVQSETSTELMHLPTLVLIFTPVGGLPPWAKAHRRRI